jgi:hypothetical protein
MFPYISLKQDIRFFRCFQDRNPPCVSQKFFDSPQYIMYQQACICMEGHDGSHGAGGKANIEILYRA